MKIIYLLSLLLIISCSKNVDNLNSNKKLYSLKFFNMGTSLSVSYISKVKDKKLEKEIVDYIEVFNNENSFYNKNSYISKINRDGYNHFIKVPNYFCKLLELSIKYSRESEYKFDITYKSPKDSRGVDNILVDCSNNRVKLLKKGVTIDTGGIAKGYAIDRVAKIIKRYNYKDFFVNFGGDIFICGSKNDKNWKIGIKDPYSNKYLKILSKPIDNKNSCYSIATSGDYERYIVKDGKKYSHIIDPKTGRSIEGAHSITVIGDNATLTDTFATAISVGFKDDDYIKRISKRFNLKVYTLTGKNKILKEYSY